MAMAAACVAVMSGLSNTATYAAGTPKTTAKKTTSQRSGGGIQTLWRSDDGKEWIHKGGKGIIIHKDSLGIVRAMLPYSNGPQAGKKYAEAINEYSRALEPDGVQVYMLVVPSMGEYYMPELTSTKGAEQRAIETAASYLDKDVIPVFINDTLKNHLDEEIYNRTDHHWAPLGAYYAAKSFAVDAEVPFRPLSDYTTGVTKDYVGTMYKFAGDPAIKGCPEEFVYYMPPEGYEAEFIIYNVKNGKTVSEGAPHKEEFFRHFPDGSGAAYCTFMGGDNRTVKVTNTGAPKNGRKLLIVKDSYGNAMASNLFGSFEEVHVADFRYFPHNLIKYIRDNGITDLVFVNCTSLAFAPATATRLDTMRTTAK